MLPLESNQLGRYQLVRKIATGGMAEVFLAKAMGPGGFEKTLVIKRILPTLAEDPEFVDMFLHEARLAAQLNHPNVVQIFDFGEVDGTFYLAMEYVDGPNLRSILRRVPDRRMPPTYAARLIIQACEGLAYAHEFADPATGQPLGLIHRDISADNLLVAKNGVVKVVDFGVAKVAGQVSKTAAGTVKGKIAYMPPEQILGETDLRSDVYALGVILYEMVAGTRPYEQMPEVQLLTAIMKRDPTPLLQRMPDAPVEFAMVVEKAMARDLSARFQDCRELQAALEDYLDGTGERVTNNLLGQLVSSVMGTPASAVSSSTLRPVTGSSATSPGSGSSGTKPQGTPVSGNHPRHKTSSGSLPSVPAVAPVIGAPASGSYSAVGAGTSPGSGKVQAPATAPAADPSAVHVGPPGTLPPTAAALGATVPDTGSYRNIPPPGASPPPTGSYRKVTLEGAAPLVPPPSAPSSAPRPTSVSGHFAPVAAPAPPSSPRPTAVSGHFAPVPAPALADEPLGPPQPAPGSDWFANLAADPEAALPSAEIVEPTRVLPPKGATPEAKANALLAMSHTMRGYHPGDALAPQPTLDELREAFEHDECVGALLRFALHAARLVPSHPHAPGLVAERLVGCVEGLLQAEAWPELAKLLERLEAAAPNDPNNRWVWDVVRASFATPDQARRVVERLGEGAPGEVAAFGRCLCFFGPDFIPYFLEVSEQLDSAASREAVLTGLAELAGVYQEPFVARMLEDRPRRLADFVWMLEKGRANDRQRVVRQLLGRRDANVRREVLTGMARAGTEEGWNLLVQALGDRTDGVRVPALELMAKHFPDRVFKAVENLLEPTSYDARPPAERVAIWRAVGSSTQPEAYYAIADVLKQKASFLNRGRLEGVKLEALEGLALMRTRQGEDLLKELAADRSQPEPVQAAAARILATPALKVPPAPPAVLPVELRRWDKTLPTPRAFLLDLLSLSQAARVAEVTAPALAVAFHRLHLRLGLLLRQVRRFEVAVSGRTVTFNGAPVLEGHPDIPMEQLATTMARDGVTGFVFDTHVRVEELRELVRWLAEGPTARGVATPNIRRGRAAPSPELPKKPSTRPPVLADPSREAMIRYVDLVLELKAYLATVAETPAARPGDSQRLIEELAMAMETRAYRFLGLTPRAVGRDAVAFHHANVAILALGFAAELRLPRARLLELAEYACLHDLGMFLLPERVLMNPGELSRSDKDALLKARLTSAWYPFERLGTGPRAARWASAVLEYGLDWGAVERDDKVSQRQEIGLVGGILSLAKSYDALTSRRSFRDAATPEAALEVLLTKSRHRFRPDLLPLFAAWVKRHWVRVLPGGR